MSIHLREKFNCAKLYIANSTVKDKRKKVLAYYANASPYATR